MIISLYAGGMTVRDIQHHLARTIGTDLSHETISKVTDAVAEEVKAWQARPLEELYPIVYLDAVVVKIRDGHQVRNKAAHIAVGVDLDGVKHVLGMWVQATEGAKSRRVRRAGQPGVRDVLIVCCDRLSGFPEAVEATWPDTTGPGGRSWSATRPCSTMAPPPCCSPTTGQCARWVGAAGPITARTT